MNKNGKTEKKKTIKFSDSKKQKLTAFDNSWSMYDDMAYN